MNKQILIIIFLSGLSFALLASQADLNKAACDEFQKADANLNDVYQQVLNNYKNDKPFIERFVMAQKKWIQFRDAYVDSMYVPEHKNEYGSVLPMCECYFIEQITKDRINQLRVWIKGTEEGDVCTGSTNILNQ